LQIKYRVLIIEKLVCFTKTLQTHLINEDYLVVDISGSVSEATQLILMYQPDLITLEIKLENDNGLDIIDFLVSNIQKLRILPLIAIISENMTQGEKQYIEKCLSKNKIKSFYINKNASHLLHTFSTNLSQFEGYFEKNINPKYNKDLVAQSDKAIIDGLYLAIQKQLKDHGLMNHSTAVIHLIALIQVYVTDSSEKKLMKNFYESVGHQFGISSEGIEKSIKRLQLEPSPKKFIANIARKINEEGF